MKYCVKKVYCPNCLRLVNCIEETRDGHLHAICSSCQSSIRIRDGSHWRVSRPATASEKIAPVKGKKAKKAEEQESEQSVSEKTK